MFKFLALFGFSLQHGFSLFSVGKAIGIGASLIGGLGGSKAAKGAASSQSASASQAIEEIKKIGERTRKDTSPYRDLGKGSANKLSYLLGIGSKTDKYDMDDFLNYNADYAPSWYQAEGPQATDANIQYDLYLKDLQDGKADYADFGGLDNLERSGFRELNNYSGLKYGGLLDKFSQADLDQDVVYNTGLKFGLDEGNKAIERNATRFGNLDSGATLKALARYGNDYGNQRAGDAYGRFMGDKQFTLNSLLGSTGIGQGAVSLDANTGSQMAQAIGNAQMAQGNANAAGQIGSANAWSGALGGIANTLGGASRGGSFNFGSIFGGGGGNRTAAYPGAYYA